MLIKKMAAVFAAAAAIGAAAFSVSAEELGTAGVYFADEDWLVQYWGGDADDDGNTSVAEVQNAVITGDGEYTASVTADYPVAGLVFLALCTDIESSSCPADMTVTVDSVEINGNAVEFGVNGKPQWKDDSGYMRVNIYNTWSDDPADKAVSDEVFDGAQTITVNFTVDGLEDSDISAETEAPSETAAPEENVPEETVTEYVPEADTEEAPAQTGNVPAIAFAAVSSWAAALALTAGKWD
ncbi:MAG: hypothetical protein MR038_02260 [Oscillospiraceae bacterium]|nr:hypothetical protein [Oscillospiraceae bacterium]